MRKLGLRLAAVLGMLVVGCADDEPATTTGGAGGAGAGGGDPGSGGSGGGPSCAGTQSDDPLFAAALQVLRDELEASGGPDVWIGGAIAVIQDGEVVDVGVAGSKRALACDPITPDTLFGAGFVTELLTAIAVLDAVEDGKLELDAPITDVIPALSVQPGRGDPSLLTNSSMYRSASSANPIQATCTTLADAFENAVDGEVQATPGSMHNPPGWNNYEIAGLALEKADGAWRSPSRSPSSTIRARSSTTRPSTPRARARSSRWWARTAMTSASTARPRVRSRCASRQDSSWGR